MTPELLTRLRSWLSADESQYECRLSVNEVREIVGALEKSGDWQPIETAPRDRWILVWDARLKRCVVVQSMTAIEDGSVDWVFARHWDEFGKTMAFISKDATHWMPLPLPPTEKVDA